MGTSKRRGYQPKDEEQFKGEQLVMLQQAAEEVQYLLDHQYAVKQVTTFVGNHYMLSERQRLALARSVSPVRDYKIRKQKLRQLSELAGEELYIDGFNTIITLEVALSGSMVLACRDGCIRDLAGLRGTYHIIDVTSTAINMVLQKLQEAGIASVIWYLDAPVSNSGRLKGLLLEIAKDYSVSIQVEVINEVDQTLEGKPNVVTSDAIILNKCKSWVNINGSLVNAWKQEAWAIHL